MAKIAPQEVTSRKPIAGWEGFNEGLWQREINLRDFIQRNYEEYAGDESFLANATDRTKKIWDRLNALFIVERKKGVLDVSPIPSSITAHAPGYIDRQNEIIVGLQTEAPVTLVRATEELGKYRYGLMVMSGGFTLSGGEPLLQDRFAVRLFAAAHRMGIHTALDTNGSLGSRLSDGELQHIDVVLLDIKCWDSVRHLKLTGHDNGPTLEFAKRLAAKKRSVWLRFVLVPGLTDDMNDIAQIAKFAAKLGNVERVDVLPFHQLGKFKWKALGLNYTLDDTHPPPRELVERACAVFRAEGLTAY